MDSGPCAARTREPSPVQRAQRGNAWAPEAHPPRAGLVLGGARPAVVCTDDTPSVTLAASKVVVHGYPVHLKDKVARCRSQGPAGPHSGSKTPPGSYSLTSTSRAQSGRREKRSDGHRQKGRTNKRLAKRRMHKKQRRPRMNQGQRTASEREKH